MMKRYNQGFLKFVPMEECDIGEWVKHSDIDSYLDKYFRRSTASEQCYTNAERT